MELNWSLDAASDPDVSDLDRMMVIKSRKLGPVVWGSCHLLHEPSQGFWFVHVEGCRALSFTKDW